MILELIDNRISYFVTFVLGYIFYFYHIIGSISEGVVFPNPIIFLYLFLLGFIMVSNMQEIDHRKVSLRLAVKWHLYCLVPPLFGFHLLRSQIKSEVEKKNDEFFILGLRVLQYVFGVIAIFYIFTVVSILILEPDVRIIYLLVHSSTGIIGFVFGYLLSRISISETISSQLADIIITPIVKTQKLRVGTTLFMLFMLFVLFLINSILSFSPITI